ncbi:MAG: PHP domain-containing protein, partial [Proteobacteria bacterium]
MKYTELQVTSNFSFLRGGSHPEELVDHAALLGYKEIAITDHNTLAGVVRAHVAARQTGLRVIIGCHLELLDGPALLAYPTDKAAYARLSGLLSKGNLRAEKGQCHLYKSDVFEHAKGLKFIAIAPTSLNGAFDFDEDFKTALAHYREKLGAALYLGMNRSYQANDTKRLFRLSQLSDQFNIRLIATNDVHYHEPERRQLQDVLTCIREKCTIHTAGFKLHSNAERYLKPVEEMERLFRQYPQALAATQEIAEACQFSLDTLEYVYPEEITSQGRTPQQELEMLTWKGAEEKFTDDELQKVSETIKYELDFMERKNYAAYFLT